MRRARLTIDQQLSDLTEQSGMLSDMLVMQQKLLQFNHASDKSETDEWRGLQIECQQLADRAKQMIEDYTP